MSAGCGAGMLATIPACASILSACQTPSASGAAAEASHQYRSRPRRQAVGSSHKYSKGISTSGTKSVHIMWRVAKAISTYPGFPWRLATTAAHAAKSATTAVREKYRAMRKYKRPTGERTNTHNPSTSYGCGKSCLASSQTKRAAIMAQSTEKARRAASLSPNSPRQTSSAW